MKLLDALLSSLELWRRLRGGHWERWHVDGPVNGLVWHRLLGRCSKVTGGRPTGLCRGTPECETWRL